MEYKYSAVSSMKEIPQETPTCKCAMCDEELTKFFVGWTMSEYEDDYRLCGEWNCWSEFGTIYESEVPFEDYVEDVDNMTQDDWDEAVNEWMFNEYDIVKSDKWK